MIGTSSRLAAAAVVFALAGSLVACSSGPTPAPTAPPTPRPTPTPVPGETPGPAALLDVTVLNFEIKPKTLLAQASTTLIIRFSNRDPDGVPHVVDVFRADGKTVIQEQEPIMGGQTIDYEYRALPPGDYVFMCRIHPIPSMTGKLTVR